MYENDGIIKITAREFSKKYNKRIFGDSRGEYKPGDICCYMGTYYINSSTKPLISPLSGDWKKVIVEA